MATDLKSHAQDVDLTRFWGGDTRGVCVQVTTPAAKPLSRTSFFDTIQLTRAQAAALGKDFWTSLRAVNRKRIFGILQNRNRLTFW